MAKCRNVPAELMKELRRIATAGNDPGVTRLAEIMAIPRRQWWEWEQKGGSTVQAYALVGLAFQLGGANRAYRTLQHLAQSEIPLMGLRAYLHERWRQGLLGESMEQLEARLDG